MLSDSLKKRAEALAAVFPLRRLAPAPLRWAEACCCEGEAWAVALSGGADSVALLLLLWAHYPARRGDLLVLHYNHRLRGAESDADEHFCRELCAALGVVLNVGRRPETLALRSEADAREARFSFFVDEMERVTAPVLWLGQQQNDVAETLLMRLVRGSGTSGLAAPRPVQKIAPTAANPQGRVHLRPLLTLRREEIESALRECAIPWRDDATNTGGAFFRNRIRRDVLPSLLAATAAEPERDALAGIALSRDLLEEDADALDAWATTIVARVIQPDGEINLRDFGSGIPRAVKRRVLHHWLHEHAGVPSLSRPAFDTLLAAMETGKSTRHSLGRDGFALIRKGRLCYEPNTR